MSTPVILANVSRRRFLQGATALGGSVAAAGALGSGAGAGRSRGSVCISGCSGSALGREHANWSSATTISTHAPAR